MALKNYFLIIEELLEYIQFMKVEIQQIKDVNQRTYFLYKLNKIADGVNEIRMKLEEEK